AARDTVSATLELAPLTVVDVQQLAGDFLGERRVSTELAARLAADTAGIPFVVEEVLCSWGNGAVGDCGKVTVMPEPGDAPEVPNTIRSAVLARLAELPGDSRQLAKAAAVLQHPVSFTLLSRVSGLGTRRARRATVAALDSALLWEPAEGCYTFRHEIGRRAVYQAIAGPQREHLHRAAIHALQRMASPPLLWLAEHSRRAGAYQHWLRHAEDAADRAARSGDVATATRVLLPLLG